MKKIISLFLLSVLMILTACAEPVEIGNTAIVYFSATGNTEEVTRELGNMLNAEVFEIVPAQPYTSEDLNYRDSSSRVYQEDRDDSARPEIEAYDTAIDSYDTLFIGFPIWFGDMPKVMYTFFDNFDAAGKTLIPFCTSGNSGITGAVRTLRTLEPDADIQDGRRINTRNMEAELTNMINSLSTN